MAYRKKKYVELSKKLKYLFCSTITQQIVIWQVLSKIALKIHSRINLYTDHMDDINSGNSDTKSIPDSFL